MRKPVVRRRGRGSPWLVLGLAALAIVWTSNKAGEPAPDARTRRHRKRAEA